MDFAVAEKKRKYKQILGFARDLKKRSNMELLVILDVVGMLRTVPKVLEKKKTGNQRMNGDHIDHSIVEIS